MGMTDTTLSARRGGLSFWVALRRYLSILLALLRREEEIKRQAPLNAILSLAEPLFLIVVMTGARYLLDRIHPPPIGNSALLFFATGICAKYAFINVSQRIRRGALGAQRRFPVEQRLDHMIVQVIIRSIDYAIMIVALFTVIYIFVTAQALPHDFVPISVAFGALILMAFGWGLVSLVIGQFFPYWNNLAPLMNRTLILFSGVFAIPDFMSPSARYILSFNPLVHAIALFRMGFYPTYPDLIFDGLYLALWVVGLVAAGLVLERVSRRYESSR